MKTAMKKAMKSGNREKKSGFRENWEKYKDVATVESAAAAVANLEKPALPVPPA